VVLWEHLTITGTQKICDRLFTEENPTTKRGENTGDARYLKPSSAAEVHFRETGYGTISVVENSLTLKAGDRIAHCRGRNTFLLTSENIWKTTGTR
jgi:hypothetical protein